MLLITDTELKLMAAPAMIGLKWGCIGQVHVPRARRKRCGWCRRCGGCRLFSHVFTTVTDRRAGTFSTFLETMRPREHALPSLVPGAVGRGLGDSHAAGRILVRFARCDRTGRTGFAVRLHRRRSSKQCTCHQGTNSGFDWDVGAAAEPRGRRRRQVAVACEAVQRFAVDDRQREEGAEQSFAGARVTVC